MPNENLNESISAVSPEAQLLSELEASTPATDTPAPATAEDIPAPVQPEMPALEGAIVQPAPEQEPGPTSEEILAELAESAPEPAAAPQEEEPEIDFNSDEFLDEFYSAPANAVEKAANVIAEKKVKEAVKNIEKRLEPLLNQSEAAKMKEEIRGTIGDFLNSTEDAKDLFPDIAAYIKMNNLDPKDKRSYLDGYRESKIGRQAKEIEQLKANQGKTLADYLNDENSLDEIIGNEAVNRRVVENYLRSLKDGAKPAVLGNGGTAQPAAQPAYSPKTLKEAGEILKSALR